VTFLFTDVEGSTQAWEVDADTTAAALERHDAVIRESAEAEGGTVVKSTGDGFMLAFADAVAAVRAAVTAQRGLVGRVPELSVRMGLHTGTAVERDGDYFGPTLNRAARVMDLGHGGQVLLSSATAALVDDHVLVDLGEHPLRGSDRVERVFQVTDPELADSFPPLRSATRVATVANPLTSFVGRDAERESLRDLVREHRLVSVTGVGGVGKTRLATEVATDVVDAFPGGSWVCELGAVTEAEAVDELVAVTVGVRPSGGVPWAEALQAHLRDRRALLVLDNCEHVLDRVAGLVEGILATCPGVHVLATSREVLSVDGERVMGLRSLGEAEAVRLFADRASAVRADFSAPEHREAIVEICRRLDGIPLALELAAARVLALEPADIASMLDERFLLLTGGRRTVERHQTLRGAVSWSYSLLTDVERTVFDRLGVFAGSFSLEAAVSVASGDGMERWDVISAMQSLVAKSMVVPDASRYRLLETLRQFALEQLGEESVERRRLHATHYAGLAEDLGALLTGPDEIEARNALLAELDDLRAATSWALASPDDEDAELGLRIVAGMSVVVTAARSSGFWTWTAEAAERVDATDDLAVRAAVLGAASFRASNYLGDTEEGRRLGEAAMAHGLQRGCAGLSLAASATAIATASGGDYAAGARMTAQVAQELGEFGDRWGEANLTAITAIFLVIAGEAAQARERAAEALELARATRSPTLLVIAGYANGMAYAGHDDDRAVASLEESLAAVAGGASDIVYAECLEQLARLRLRVGDVKGCLDAVIEGGRFAAEVGNRHSFVTNLWYALDLLAELGADEFGAVADGATGQGAAAIPARMPITTEHAQGHNDAVATFRDRLGDEVYDELHRRGQAMTYEELVEYATAELEALATAIGEPGAVRPRR
jgi:predicted ATPase